MVTNTNPVGEEVLEGQIGLEGPELEDKISDIPGDGIVGDVSLASELEKETLSAFFRELADALKKGIIGPIISDHEVKTGLNQNKADSVVVTSGDITVQIMPEGGIYLNRDNQKGETVMLSVHTENPNQGVGIHVSIQSPTCQFEFQTDYWNSELFAYTNTAPGASNQGFSSQELVYKADPKNRCYNLISITSHMATVFTDHTGKLHYVRVPEYTEIDVDPKLAKQYLPNDRLSIEKVVELIRLGLMTNGSMAAEFVVRIGEVWESKPVYQVNFHPQQPEDSGA